MGAQAEKHPGSISICVPMYDDISKALPRFEESICSQLAVRQGDYEPAVATRAAAECAVTAPAQACCHVPKVHGNCSRAKMRCEGIKVEALNE